MGCHRMRLRSMGYCVPVIPIPSTPGWTAMSGRASPACTSVRDAAVTPRFPPHLPDAATAQANLLDLVGRSPHLCGRPQSRWTATALGQQGAWLGTLSRSGISRMLHRLGIHWKHSRAHVHSPDPAYLAKRAAIRTAVASRGPHTVVCFLDEVTLYRQPTLAPAYAACGRDQALAERSHAADTPHRVLATLDAATGQVHWCRRRRLTVATFVRFFTDLTAAYPDATQILVVLDNWPVHFHPDLRVALHPQQPPFPFPRPPSWPSAPRPAARKKWGGLQLPIQLLPLPTYASWLNPIEKLWRWLRQDVVHRHPWADDLPALQTATTAFLDQFRDPSPALLRYTGLPLPT
jgi:hypothetical protein